MTKNEIVKIEPGALLRSKREVVISTWADSTTSATSDRRDDLLREKKRVVNMFFDFVGGLNPGQVSPTDVINWREELERTIKQDGSPAYTESTIYGMVSKVSSLFRWMKKVDPVVNKTIRINPVDFVRPKSPRPYERSSKALHPEQIKKLLAVIHQKAESGSVIGKRDFALTMLLYATGKRRAEVLRLRWDDFYFANGSMTIRFRVKGGDIENLELFEQDAPQIKAAIFDYLHSSGRLKGIKPETPLWTRHDRETDLGDDSKKHAGRLGEPLTGYAYSLALKRYAKSADIPYIHVHQLRHSRAHIEEEITGSISSVQDLLGHKSQSTTKKYLGAVRPKKIKTAGEALRRAGVER